MVHYWPLFVRCAKFTQEVVSVLFVGRVLPACASCSCTRVTCVRFVQFVYVVYRFVPFVISVCILLPLRLYTFNWLQFVCVVIIYHPIPFCYHVPFIVAAFTLWRMAFVVDSLLGVLSSTHFESQVRENGDWRTKRRESLHSSLFQPFRRELTWCVLLIVPFLCIFVFCGFAKWVLSNKGMWCKQLAIARVWRHTTIPLFKRNLIKFIQRQ